MSSQVTTNAMHGEQIILQTGILGEFMNPFFPLFFVRIQHTLSRSPPAHLPFLLFCVFLMVTLLWIIFSLSIVCVSWHRMITIKMSLVTCVPVSLIHFIIAAYFHVCEQCGLYHSVLLVSAGLFVLAVRVVLYRAICGRLINSWVFAFIQWLAVHHSWADNRAVSQQREELHS